MKKYICFTLSAIFILLVLSGCGKNPLFSLLPEASSADTNPGSSFTLTSSGLSNGGIIAEKYAYTETGPNTSIPLSWSNAPSDTQSFALIMYDQNASDFVHWMATDIPASISSFSEGESPLTTLQGREYTNMFGNYGYSGPHPPSGETHIYILKIYALNVSTVNIDAGIPSRAQFLSAITPSIVGESNTLLGRYTVPYDLHY
ncbi:MAG: YbhB/YbcL family Raf kinase inhibitor-like protein [Candidatus Firestonebacteria bacterium]